MKNKLKSLSIEQFANFFGVNSQQVVRWIKNKEITATKSFGKKEYKIAIDNLKKIKRQKNCKIFARSEIHTKSQPKVLIIDDKQDVVESISPIFSNHGFKILSSNDANEAVFILHEELPQILTLDLGLNESSGIEILEMMNDFGLKQNIWVIVISGASEIDLRFAVDSGADFYLQKPYSENDLNKIIQKLSRNVKKKIT